MSKVPFLSLIVALALAFSLTLPAAAAQAAPKLVLSSTQESASQEVGLSGLPQNSQSLQITLTLSQNTPCTFQLSQQEVVADLNACNDKIEAITGVRPTLVRLPYGDYDDCSIQAVRSIGMEPIQWDVDSLDWKEISAPEIQKRVVSKVCPGSIVLFHNAALHTPEALPGILEQLTQEGYTFVPISQLILTEEYSIDHTGRQCPAE